MVAARPCARATVSVAKGNAFAHLDFLERTALCRFRARRLTARECVLGVASVSPAHANVLLAGVAPHALRRLLRCPRSVPLLTNAPIEESVKMVRACAFLDGAVAHV